ncbi:hypothetical protein D3C79_946560 [compost metagenome]
MRYTPEMASETGKVLTKINKSLPKNNDRNLIIASTVEAQDLVALEVYRNPAHIRNLSNESAEGSSQAVIA